MHGSAELEIFTLKGKKWMYRGEGNANLVLALPESRQILRIRKCTPEDKIIQREIIIRNLLFFTNFVIPLMEPYVDAPRGVILRESEIEALTETLSSMRPAFRMHGKSLSSCGVLCPDYAFLPRRFIDDAVPTFCVELKPKQGWIPIPDRNLDLCNFCLNQYLKYARGTTKEISRYCPMDLYSGDERRMRRAVVDLMMSPQNNLKVFKDGIPVYDGDTRIGNLDNVLTDFFGEICTDRFPGMLSEIVTAALVKNSAGDDALPRVDGVVGCDFVDVPTHRFRDTVLDKLFAMQKLNLEGFDKTLEICREYEEMNGKDFWSSVNYAPFGFRETNYPICRFDNRCHETIGRYLLFATARDCSVMISFQSLMIDQASCGDLDIIECKNGRRFLVNIAVTDLDPKPITSVSKHKNDRLAACKARLEGWKGLR